MKIKEMIVVEGYHDKQAILKVVEANVIITNGSHIKAKTIELIKEAQATSGVIVFTDPDNPGKRLRALLDDKIPWLKHAVLPSSVARDKRKVGVEHASSEHILLALNNLYTLDDQTSDLTLNDLIDLKLSGHPESQALRKQLANCLHIQEGNAKSFLKQCQFKHLTKDDLEKKLITCKNP